MAKPSLSPNFFLCFLLFTFSCTARQLPRHDPQSQFNECQLDSINALEPDHRVESEAGVTETWNANRPELRCAGVAVIKRTINSHGLHLPSYVSFPELHFVVQGEGIFGIAIPGCAETFTEPQKQRGGERPKLRQLDHHQKVRYLRQGDIIAIPPGIPYWSYNCENTPLVIISLLDTSNSENQLDRIPRRFYLAGKPEEEYSEKKERHGKQEEEGNNIFGGFDQSFLAEAFNVNEKITEKLQSSGDQIIKVKGGLGIVRPPLEHEVREREEEERRHGREREEEEPRRRERREWHRETHRHGEGEGEGEEVVEEKETRTREHHRGGHGEREVEEGEETTTREGEEGEEEVERHTRRRKRHERHHGDQGPDEDNSLEETVCTLKLHENIADPARADLFNPRAGRISTINSFTLPVLKQLHLSAEWVNLYKGGIYVPHWNINANSVIYVTRGRGRVQVVNCQGKTVFNGEVRSGQLVVVPQNFAVAKQAGKEGMEYVDFKTNDRAMISTLVGPNSAITAIPAEVLANAFGLSPEEVSSLKNNRKEGILASPGGSQSQSLDSFIKMV